MSEPEQVKPEQEAQEPGQEELEVHDPAQALASMADEEDQGPAQVQVSPDPTEALDELADRRADSATELSEISTAGPEEPAVDLDVPEEAVPSGPQALEARRAHAARAARRAARATSEQYRRVMIPFLLVVAGLLIVVGAVSAGYVASATPEERDYAQWYPYMTYVMVVSFPLAAVLCFGAWWFRRELKGR